jgi:hypothetical protein
MPAVSPNADRGGRGPRALCGVHFSHRSCGRACCSAPNICSSLLSVAVRRVIERQDCRPRRSEHLPVAALCPRVAARATPPLPDTAVASTRSCEAQGVGNRSAPACGKRQGPSNKSLASISKSVCGMRPSVQRCRRLKNLAGVRHEGGKNIRARCKRTSGAAPGYRGRRAVLQSRRRPVRSLPARASLHARARSQMAREATAARKHPAATGRSLAHRRALPRRTSTFDTGTSTKTGIRT